MFENFTSEERPSEWMWPFGDLMNSHFDQVAADRKEKMGGDPQMDKNALFD